MIVAFDVDGTLIQTGESYPDVPRYDVIDLLHRLHSLGATIVVWSGGGVEYAKHLVEKLGLSSVTVEPKGSFVPDLAIDDEVVQLGKVNLQV